MLENIQRLGRVQRLLIFILIFGAGLLLLVALTVLLISNSLNKRSESQGLADGVTVKEWAVLPDDDAYPAALAVAPDGSVYTGSYKTGVLWKIDAAGKIVEVPGSREAIGAVAGLSVAPDGTVYIVDQNDADPRTSGGNIKRLAVDGTISTLVEQPDKDGFISPDDITLDSAGNVYVSDRGRNVIWRFTPDGSDAKAWWTPPVLEGAKTYQPTGLAYDSSDDSILVTDGVNDTLYRVSVADASSQLLYQHGQRPNPPGFDGLTVTPEGVIYIAALGQNGIVRLDGDQINYIAGLFRGASDVDYNPALKRLYVTNFDSAALAYSFLQPHLPFALDEVDLPPTG